MFKRWEHLQTINSRSKRFYWMVSDMWSCFVSPCILIHKIRPSFETVMVIRGRTKFRLRQAVSVIPDDIGLTIRNNYEAKELCIFSTYTALHTLRGCCKVDKLIIKIFHKHALLLQGGSFKVNSLHIRDTKGMSANSPCICISRAESMGAICIENGTFFVRGAGKTVLLIGDVRYVTRNVALFARGVTLNNSADTDYFINAENLQESSIGSVTFPITKSRIGEAVIKIVNPQIERELAVKIYVAKPYPNLDIQGTVDVIQC